MAAPTTNPRHEKDTFEDMFEFADDPRYDDSDISTVPFVEQPAFGRGLWKKPVSFVPEGAERPSPTKGLTPDGRTMAEAYAAIFLPNGPPQPKPPAGPLCDVCGCPVTEKNQRDHYLSLSHQLALPRAPIPSAIDRTRMGLKYMEKHGYDVDAQKGLGATGEGMLYPIVPKEKRDKFGLGINVEEHTKKKALGGASAADVKQGKLDAGKVRKLAAVEKKRHEKLQRAFYGNDEVEKYLGRLHG